MNDLDSATKAAETAVRGSAGAMVTGLIERIGGMARADAVFGAPVEREGITVVPVASVRWGGGGGGGTGNEAGKQGEGGGGGGGVSAKPVGYIEMRNGEAHFVRIRDFGAFVPLILASGVCAMIVLRSLRALATSRERSR